MSDVLKGKQIRFVGAGNMAEALVQGLLRAGVASADDVQVSDLLPARVAHFRDRYGVAGTAENTALVAGADVVVLAVKPQGLDAVLTELAGGPPADALWISICAGVRTGRIEEALGGSVRVVRVMPNTPALVGAGAAAVAAGAHAQEPDLAVAEAMLRAVGTVVRVPEQRMDAVTALSGSGPAYVCYLIESMLEAADRLGLGPDLARALIYATVSGTAKMVTETGLDPAELRRRVTSKGGTTEAALRVLDAAETHRHWVEAIEAACRRSEEMSGG